MRASVSVGVWECEGMSVKVSMRWIVRVCEGEYDGNCERGCVRV